jgi:hypothetical protein
MKKKNETTMEPGAAQPQPFTPGVTREMVRRHAYELYRHKLHDHPLTLEDWVLAEKDLVNLMQTGQAP